MSESNTEFSTTGVNNFDLSEKNDVAFENGVYYYNSMCNSDMYLKAEND